MPDLLYWNEIYALISYADPVWRVQTLKVETLKKILIFSTQHLYTIRRMGQSVAWKCLLCKHRSFNILWHEIPWGEYHKCRKEQEMNVWWMLLSFYAMAFSLVWPHEYQLSRPAVLGIAASYYHVVNKNPALVWEMSVKIHTLPYHPILLISTLKTKCKCIVTFRFYIALPEMLVGNDMQTIER